MLPKRLWMPAKDVYKRQDKNFAEKLMNDADRLYQVGNLYLLDITPFTHLREIGELEDMNEWKTQLCVHGFLLLNIFLGVIGTFWFRTQPVSYTHLDVYKRQGEYANGCGGIPVGECVPGADRHFLVPHP